MSVDTVPTDDQIREYLEQRHDHGMGYGSGEVEEVAGFAGWIVAYVDYAGKPQLELLTHTEALAATAEAYAEDES